MPTLPAMQPLAEYDISTATGFLPEKPPVRRLLDPYFSPWEDMMDDFNGLLLAGKLRERIHQMPQLDATRLDSIENQRRAFLVLCMLSHGYVWGKHEPTSEVLPANLAVPWIVVAESLGLCPVVCHAAVVLWNYRLLDPEGPIDLGNIATLATYSGSLDESWFYLVTTAIESAGAPCLPAIVQSIEHIQKNELASLHADLSTIKSCLQAMNGVLRRMYEKCDPYVFYWKIRPYLAGWENMAEAGLPFGLIYEGAATLWHAATDEYGDMSHLSEVERLLRQYRRYAGGSAAQSSLIAALDIAFGVEHHPTKEQPHVEKNADTVANDRYHHLPSTNPADELDDKTKDTTDSASNSSSPPRFVRKNRNAFLRAMRKYMPQKHRAFLEDLEQCANLRAFMLHLQDRVAPRTSEETDLLVLYNECLAELKQFRDIHVQIVTLYIVNQARKGPNIAHGGFAMDKRTENEDPQDSAQHRKRKGHDGSQNMLYPQTALGTQPGIQEGSMSAKVTHLIPELGLAKHVDPRTGVVRGTGGTNVLPFLKQSRDETAESQIPLNKKPDTEAHPIAVPKRSWFDWMKSPSKVA